jgi:hypothetical protein
MTAGSGFVPVVDDNAGASRRAVRLRAGGRADA